MKCSYIYDFERALLSRYITVHFSIICICLSLKLKYKTDMGSGKNIDTGSVHKINIPQQRIKISHHVRISEVNVAPVQLFHLDCQQLHNRLNNIKVYLYDAFYVYIVLKLKLSRPFLIFVCRVQCDFEINFSTMSDINFDVLYSFILKL